jgi:hypothetical protein
MGWLSDNLFGIISLLFGAGGIGYAVVSRVLDRKKYAQEVRVSQADADIKEDDFWKKRYDVLQAEVDNKDSWWKERYDALYAEYQNERKLSNEIVKSFRTELNEMRADYEKQRELEKMKYDKLMEQYRSFEEESQKRETEYKQRISQLEDLVASYEQRLKEE